MSQPWMQKHRHACSHPYDNPALHMQPECAYPHNCRGSAPPWAVLAQLITSLPCPSSTACWQGQTCLHICFIPIWPHACLHVCYGQAMPCGGMSTCLHICCVPALLHGHTGNPVGMPLCPNNAIELASMPVCMPATINTVRWLVVPHLFTCLPYYNTIASNTGILACACAMSHYNSALWCLHHACSCLACPCAATWQWGTPSHSPAVFQHPRLVVCVPAVS